VRRVIGEGLYGDVGCLDYQSIDRERGTGEVTRKVLEARFVHYHREWLEAVGSPEQDDVDVEAEKQYQERMVRGAVPGVRLRGEHSVYVCVCVCGSLHVCVGSLWPVKQQGCRCGDVTMPCRWLCCRGLFLLHHSLAQHAVHPRSRKRVTRTASTARMRRVKVKGMEKAAVGWSRLGLRHQLLFLPLGTDQVRKKKMRTRTLQTGRWMQTRKRHMQAQGLAQVLAQALALCSECMDRTGRACTEVLV